MFLWRRSWPRISLATNKKGLAHLSGGFSAASLKCPEKGTTMVLKMKSNASTLVYVSLLCCSNFIYSCPSVGLAAHTLCCHAAHACRACVEWSKSLRDSLNSFKKSAKWLGWRTWASGHLGLITFRMINMLMKMLINFEWRHWPWSYFSNVFTKFMKLPSLVKFFCTDFKYLFSFSRHELVPKIIKIICYCLSKNNRKKAAELKVAIKTWLHTAKCKECNVWSPFLLGPLLVIL